jgi:hypothetical protein
MDRRALQWQEDVEKLSTTQVFALMDFPLREGLSEAHIFIDKSLSTRLPEIQIFDQLTYDYEDQSIFRKEQSCVAVCVLHERAIDAAIRDKCRAFLERIADGELPLLNQVECAFLRVVRKLSIMSRHPLLRDKIANQMKAAPELERFVGTLPALDANDDTELALHNLKLTELRSLTKEQLETELADILKTENAMEDDFTAFCATSSGPESRIGGFEYYGMNGRHDAFKTIVRSFRIR